VIPRLRAVLLLALVCVLVNFGALGAGFIHDDHRIIEQNDLTADLRHAPQIFTSGYWSAADAQVPNLYRPVTILSFAMDRAVHGLRPLGFRLVDLILHVVATVLVFHLASRLFAKSATGTESFVDRAFLAALLFAVHPAHTDALGVIVGRAELLAAVSALGSVLAFLRAREAGAQDRRGAAPAGLYALSIALFALGFLAKENAVVVPGLLLLADLLVVRRRPAWAFHAASALGLLSVLALRASVLGAINPAGAVHFVDNPIAHLPFVEGRLTALKILARYAALLVWPAGLSIDYSYRAIPPASGPLDPGVLAGAAIVLAWALGVVVAWKRAPSIAFALAWPGVALAPVANLLFPIGTIMAERLLYLPSVGFCIVAAAAVALGLARLLSIPATPPLPALAGRRVVIGRLIVGLVVLALSVQTVARLRDWRDDYTIFRAAVRVAPDSVRSQFNYGSACEERGDDASAIEAYGRALEVWPGFADAHYNLAGVLSRQKRPQEAVDHYREALRLKPGDVRYLVNLAHGLNGIGRPSEARDLLRRAIDLDPKSSLAYTNLGAVELALGDARAALEAYAEAVRLDPANADYLRNLGVAQREAHDRGAADSFRSALLIRPGDPELLDGLGLTLLDAGDPAGARDALERAVGARPAHPIYRYHLARVLEQAGDLQGASTHYREAIRLAPSVPFPYKALGLLLDRLGDRDGAVAALERAAALDPGGSVMDEAARGILVGLRRRTPGGPRR
jgi:protein O-mannosyl-transferase